MKHYSVMCILSKPFNMGNIDVYAENPEEAKVKAVAQLKATGYPDAELAPDFPGAPLVVELHDLKKYEVTVLVPYKGQRAEVTVRTKGSDVNEAIANAIDAVEHNGYYGGVVSVDALGRPKVSEGWNE